MTIIKRFREILRAVLTPSAPSYATGSISSKLIIAILGSLVLLAPLPIPADICSWRDQTGILRFGRCDGDRLEKGWRLIIREGKPTETQQKNLVSQGAFLELFTKSCERYDKQPNEIKKSEVFRDSQKIYSKVGLVVNWEGVLTRIATDRGGERAWLIIRVGNSRFFSNPIGRQSRLYREAAKMVEDEKVVFSGSELRGRDKETWTEKGMVCDPDFSIKLVEIKKKSR